MAGVRVTVDKSYQKNAQNAVESICYNQFGENAYDIGETFIQICTPYVPWRTGELAGSGHVVNTSKDELSVAWNKSKNGFDIAREQYYHPHNHLEGRTDHWDQTAMEYSGELFRQRCEKILNGR